MATPANWEQFNEDMRQWQQQAEDLARIYRGLVDVAASGDLGALAFIADLSSAPIGDRASLQQSLQVENVAGRGVIGPGGDLMAVGAFGLGREGYLLSDFDAPPDRNEFYIGAGTNATGDHAGAAYWPGIDLYRSSSDRGARMMFGPDSLLVRGWTGGDVVSDFSVYNNKNILGTVSQESGIPTGAIIEQGSNANGQYTKFTDGTVLAFGTQALEADISLPSGELYTSANLSLPLPVTGNWVFVDVKKKSNAGSLIPVFSTTVFGVSSNSIGFRPVSTGSHGVVSVPFEYFAIGRWD